MLNLKLTVLLILSISLTGYCQWDEKSISTNAVFSCLDFVNDDVGFVTGGSMIFETENGGALGEDISPSIAEGLTSIHFPSFNTGAVGGNGSVVKVESAGIITSIKSFELKANFKVSQIQRLIT